MCHVLSVESNDTGCIVIRENENWRGLRWLFIERHTVEENKNQDLGKLRFVQSLCETAVNVLISRMHCS